MRRAPQLVQNPRRLQLKATSFSWAQSAQRRRERAVGEDAALKKGLELGFDKLGQACPGLGFDLGQESFEVFLYQLAEDGFFGTPPLVVDAFSRRRKLGCLVHRP
ncbi:MAG: hypothetical protein ACREX4_25495 [Gammaproteobacteria bacterium]